MVAAARAAHGPIDIVIANAGMAASAPFGKIDSRHWQRTHRRQSHRRIPDRAARRSPM